MTDLARPTIRLYHGGSQWKGPPEVRPPKKGRAEHGAGIYLTTSLDTARKYAAGNKIVTAVDLSLPIRLANGSFVSYRTATNFAYSLPAKQRKLVSEAIARVRQKMPAAMPADSLVAIAVNSDASHGAHGNELTRILVANGVDALLVNFASEDWLVLFNASAIAHWEKADYWAPANLSRLDARSFSTRT